MNVAPTGQGRGPARSPADDTRLPTDSADLEHPRDTGSFLWKVIVAGAIFFAVAFFVVALG